VVSRWHFLVAVVVVSVFAVGGTAYATPTYLSAINISDAGQDGFEPQVINDPSGNVHAVWTRSDGVNFRIQYSTRTPSGSWSAPINLSDATQSASQPQIDADTSGNLLVVWTRSDGTNLRIQATFKSSGGSFSTPVNISDPGFDANEPQVDFDGSNKAIAVWSRFDGSNLRVQASTRTAGPSGVFSNEVTLSEGGQDAFDAQIDAGPNSDANAVIVWTRSDGTKLRVQSSRRRDVVGYPRPKGASALRVPMVPAYQQCNVGSANRTHGPGLVFPSCNPPVRSSSVLTVGSPDVAGNGFPANSVSSVRWKVIPGQAATEANEADVQAIVAVTDVRNHPSNTDYTGPVGIRANLQITDHQNSPEQPEPGTTQVFPLEFPVQCIATADTTRGSNCNSTTSMNAILPGSAEEIKRSIWEIGQTVVRDAGPNGTGYAACPPTCGDGDETVYMRQGIFVP
jgi:hypothetical protein